VTFLSSRYATDDGGNEVVDGRHVCWDAVQSSVITTTRGTTTTASVCLVWGNLLWQVAVACLSTNATDRYLEGMKGGIEEKMLPQSIPAPL